MDCVSPLLDVATRLWNCTAKRAVYIHDLNEILESLRNRMEELKNIAEDVKTKVEHAEETRRMRRTHEVDGWLHSVEVMEKEVMEILQKGDREVQQKCIGSCCPKNCPSSYKIGKIASKKLGAVTDLRSKGCFTDVANRLRPPPVDERPVETTVGLDSIYAEVCRCIQDEQLGIIGLYGMGGSGKTTLMTKANNEFIKTSKDFEIAIWVVVSRPASVGKVQEVLHNKLEIPDDIWRNRSDDEKAVEIFNVLKTKRFVILLDDVWERLDLQKVGVPSPNSQNKSKVILTTRSRDVCRHMEAQKSIKVECLERDEAIALFKKKVGESTLNSHPDIPKLAEIAAEECKGLPLALITIGRAMVGKNTPQEWELAIEMLKTYPSKFSGMGDHVFPVLKFSYDSLQNDTTKSCFLYLAMFQEDYGVKDDDLINLWIGEGILDEFDNLHEARNQGYDIIQRLKVACLFEGNEYDQVKMHDVIRDMALWLASEYSGNKNKILAQEVDTLEAHQVSKWKEAQWISLWSSSTMKKLTIPPSCPNLSTLIVRSEVLATFPDGFFHLMPIIKVLDLSGTRITELPAGIDKLATLQYLNLSNTNIKELSTEIKTLKRIKCLILDRMLCLKIISKEVISNLSSLKLFSMQIFFSHDLRKELNYSSSEEEAKDSWEENKATYLSENNKALLEELECLEFISEVSFPIEGALSFQKLLNSPKLQNAVRWLSLGNLEDMAALQLPRMKHLHTLRIQMCWELEEIKVDQKKEQRRSYVAGNVLNSNFHSLRHVVISQLPKLLDLTWLIYIPSVEVLGVIDCKSTEEVICDENGISQDLGIFSRLRELHLDYLPNLKSICGQALPFPCLTVIFVRNCPKLRRLPLNSNSANNSLKVIRGNPRWWERLQWEDETIMHTFNSYFTAV